MKKLVITSNNTIVLGEQIIANESLPKQTEQFVFYKNNLMTALEERMDQCLHDLSIAIKEDKIVQVTKHVITFVYASGVYHKFFIPSYLAMEKALATLSELNNQITVSEFAKKFTKPEINQMKKALVDYEAYWSDTCSALEEIEMMK